MNNIKIIGIGALCFILGFVVSYLLVGNQSADSFGASGGLTRLPNGGMAMRYLKVTTSANTATAGTDGALNIGAGTDINKYLCGTNTTFNPASITSSTDSYATTSVTVAGAAIGDVVLVTLSTASSSDIWSVDGKITTAGQVNVMLTANATINMTTTTVKACVIN